MILHLKILNNMEVIVKSSPKIEIELATKVVKVGGKVTVDSALSTESENPVMNKVITVALNEKVDKVSGKGLSTNDYTTSEKEKLASLENYDDGEIRTSLEEVETQIESQDALIKDLQDGKANKEGNYPSLRVGTADTAIDLAGRGESVPAEFGFRASGGKSIKDGRAYIKRIKGNSVVWNQMFTLQYATTISSGVKISKNADNSLTCVGTLTNTYFNFIQFQSNIENHKYLFILYASAALDGCSFGLLNRNAQMKISGGFAYIFHTNSDISKGKYIGITELSVGNEINENLFVLQIDLTKMFQAGNEPTTIEEFNARVATLGVDMNAYNEGQVIHCNTESIKSVGDNAWDEEWEVGAIASSTGQNSTNANGLRSKNYIKVLGGKEYYIKSINITTYVFAYDENKNFLHLVTKIGAGSNVGNNTITLESNVAYIRFYVANYGSTYNHDIMISLVHSGWKQDTDAGYQPYWQDTLPLPIIRKYFPQGMKSAGTAHDEIRYNKANGKWEAVQRIGSVDLGNYAFYKDSSRDFFKAIVDGMLVKQNYVCAKYDNIRYLELGSAKGIYLNIESTRCIISILDPSYGDDYQKFRQDLQGVMLYYELAEPIVTELDAEDQNFRDYYNVADFGTEMSQSSVPSAPFSADIIYQFNAVDMIREHEAEITELQNVIATMQAQLTSLINGGQ